MDVALILTYRCSSRCSMCYVWQNPTDPRREVSLATLDGIPEGIDYLNLTGGEPPSRADLGEIPMPLSSLHHRDAGHPPRE